MLTPISEGAYARPEPLAETAWLAEWLTDPRIRIVDARSKVEYAAGHLAGAIHMDGRSQEPGGWNRIMLQVTNLPDRVAALKKAGLHFRNDMEVGPGGKQIQLEDPDGNPIELFEPAR